MVTLTFALLGGVWTPPCGVQTVKNGSNTQVRQVKTYFHLPYLPSFLQLLWKFQIWVIQGQVTRSGQVTTLYKNFTIVPKLQCLSDRMLWNLRNLIRSSEPTKPLFQIFDICDLRSGNFRDLPNPDYKSIGKHWTTCFTLHLEPIWMESHHVRYLLTSQVKFFVFDPLKVIWGHSRSPAVFWQ